MINALADIAGQSITKDWKEALMAKPASVQLKL
jgi:hypothetical protein